MQSFARYQGRAPQTKNRQRGGTQQISKKAKKCIQILPCTTSPTTMGECEWVRQDGGVCGAESGFLRVSYKKKIHIWAHLKDRREEKSETRKMETSSNKTKYLKNSTEKPRKQKKMWRSCFLCLCGYLSSSQFFPIQCISERATKRKYFYPFTKRTTRLEWSCRENTKRSWFLDRMDVSRLLGSTWSGPVQHHVMCPHCKANGTTEGVGVRMRGRLSKLISGLKRVREKIRESD